ncbi:hypothetical protein BH23PLA1_BH23PLA1_31380 [soil metagenome]
MKMPSLTILALLNLTFLAASPTPAAVAPQDSTLVRMLKGGKVPEERQGTIIEMIGRRGNPADLAYLFEQAIDPDGFSEAVRLKAIAALIEAAESRKAQPEGDLEQIGRLIRPEAAGQGAAESLAAVRLVGLWRLEGLRDDLKEIAVAPKARANLRQATLDSLAAIGGDESRAIIEGLTTNENPQDVRYRAVSALARLDLDAATDRALAVLGDETGRGDPAPMLNAFLNRQGGADRLAKGLEGAEIPPDAAKLALRYLYSVGRSDPALVGALSRTAGISAEAEPFTQQEMDQFIADVQQQGDPERGEVVFRRPDLSCLNCHAVAGAGGDIGPELSGLGVSSPLDYIINAVLLPDDAIKEGYETLVVLTLDGQIYQGIVENQNEERLILKESTGERRVVSAEDIEDHKEGGSLMPQGLVNFMTRAEFVDLTRFLSELGQPGPYAVASTSTPTIQRWRVLQSPPEGSADEATLREEVLGADDSRWEPAYARVSGLLPLDELIHEDGPEVLYLKGEIELTTAGELGFRLNAAEGVQLWLGEESVPAAESFTAELPPGRHALTLQVDPTRFPAEGVRVELFWPEGSQAEFAVVRGR